MANFKQSFAVLMILLPLALSLYTEMEYLGRVMDVQYKLVYSDHFDDVLRALGASLAIRALALVAKPVDSISRSPDNYDVYTYTSKWGPFTIKETWTPGIPFNYTTYDGRKVNVMIHVEGPFLLHEVQEEITGRKTIIDRKFTDDQLKMTIRVGKVVSTRVYKARTSETSEDTQDKQLSPNL